MTSEERKEYDRQYRANNKARLVEYRRRYRKTHSKERLEYSRRWRETHRDRAGPGSEEHSLLVWLLPFTPVFIISIGITNLLYIPLLSAEG